MGFMTYSEAPPGDVDAKRLRCQPRENAGPIYFSFSILFIYLFIILFYYMRHMNIRGPWLFTHNCNVARMK